MASPQLEDGYLKIANEIIEALIDRRYKITGEQMVCLLFILRKTYGFNKKWDIISNKQFVEATGINKQNAHRAVLALVDKKIVIKEDNNPVPRYRFNKNYKKWKVSSKKMTSSKKITPVIKEDDKVSSKKTATKDIKDNLKDKRSEQAPSHFEFHVGDSLENILLCSEKIELLKSINHKGFNPYMWVQVQVNNKGHPEAILHTLEEICKRWKEIDNPWTYGNKIMATKSGNYHEADHIKQHEEFKGAFDIDPRVKKLLKPIGG